MFCLPEGLGEKWCVPHTPGSGTKLIYTQLKPSKHWDHTADQINVSVTIAFSVVPCLSFSGPLLSGKIRGASRWHCRVGVSVSVPCKAEDFEKEIQHAHKSCAGETIILLTPRLEKGGRQTC